jgi:hypothetical protein
MDDPDMRYGFAIDRLFSKRVRAAKRYFCVCGAPIGVGQEYNRKLCNSCRDKDARRVAKRLERETARRNALALARIRRDTRRQLRRALRENERIAAAADGRRFEQAPPPKIAASAAKAPVAKPRRRGPAPHPAPAGHPWRKGHPNA